MSSKSKSTKSLTLGGFDSSCVCSFKKDFTILFMNKKAIVNLQIFYEKSTLLITQQKLCRNKRFYLVVVHFQLHEIPTKLNFYVG